MAFDRNAAFLLSKFSTHVIEWPTPVATWKVHVYGLEKFTRSCPTVVYEAEKMRNGPGVEYVVRACGEVPELKIDFAIWVIVPFVSLFQLNCKLFDAISLSFKYATNTFFCLKFACPYLWLS